MDGFEFTHGTRFLLDNMEYVVRRANDRVVEVLNLPYQKTETWDASQLWNAWNEERLLFVSESGEPERLPGSILDFALVGDDVRQETIRRYQIIEPFITGRKRPGELLEYLGSLQVPISKTQFYEYKKIWEQYRDIRYLAPNRKKRGPHGNRTEAETQNLIAEIIKPLYKGEKRTDQALYDEYCIRVEEENQFGKNLPVISESTFKRRKRELLDRHQINVVMKGRHLADLSKNGSLTEVYVERPLSRIEIDSTPGDVLLINPATGNLEHPYILLAWEKFSDGPIGWDVGFGAPDTASLKRCLLHVMCPKGYVRDVYPLVQGEWGLFGKPRLIVLDNAKINESKEFEEICRLLNIEVMYTKVGAGNQKGSVERGLRSLSEWIHSLPGTTFSNPAERGRYNSESNACISMQTFIYQLHIWAVDLMVHGWNSSIESTPYQRWLDGWIANKHLMPSLPRTKEELMFLLMTGHEVRTITNKGIVIDNQYFNSPELMELRSWIVDSGNGDLQVRVRFDTGDMRDIYVYDEHRDRFVRAHQTGMVRKGINTDLPVPRLDLKVHALLVTQQKKSVDRKKRAVARRNIDSLSKQERKNKRLGLKPPLKVPSVADYYGISIRNNAFDDISNVYNHTGEVSNVEAVTSTKPVRPTKAMKDHLSPKAENPVEVQSSAELNEEEFNNWEVSTKSIQRGERFAH